VRPGSPAARAGLRGGSTTATIEGRTLTVGGDVIVAVAGRTVARFSDLGRAISARRPGARVTLAIIRGGARLDVSVTLGAQPG
jgi:S1-C subfamily serine protease